MIFTTIYFYNKSIVVEKLTNIDSSEILQKLSSIYNEDTLTVKNLNVTGKITTQDITSKSINGDKLTVPDITTYNLHSNKGDNSWIDIHSNCHIYKTAYTDSDFECKGMLKAPKITTYHLYSTNGDNSWIDIHPNCHIYKSAYTDSDFECKGTLKAPKNFSFQNSNISKQKRTASNIPMLCW